MDIGQDVGFNSANLMEINIFVISGIIYDKNIELYGDWWGIYPSRRKSMVMEVYGDGMSVVMETSEWQWKQVYGDEMKYMEME
jgi:hypothetical protein